MRIVRVNAKAANRAASGHPWIFSSDVVDRGEVLPGEVVHVVEQRGRSLGTAHYSSTSQITLRLLSRVGTSVDRRFFDERFAQALKLRRRVVQNSQAYRLIHAEGDLLPGLIVDIYGECAVIQTLTQGMDAAKPLVVESLLGLLPLSAIVERNDAAVREREALPRTKGLLFGQVKDVTEIRFNELVWRPDLLAGQKTGVYLDQRENYLAAAKHATGKALDCFTSTGGFALHLARVCEMVEAVDSSEHALVAAKSNAAANKLSNVTFKEADVFDLLANYTSGKRKFDTIVLDPPAFAKSRSQLEGAARGYKELNQRALRLLQSGGILISCSCSHHFSEAMLLQTIAEASLDAGKTLRILERRTQAQDHPILLTVPETHYLKCLIFEVV